MVGQRPGSANDLFGHDVVAEQLARNDFYTRSTTSQMRKRSSHMLHACVLSLLVGTSPAGRSASSADSF
jgi:hypothetical protein